MRVNVISESAFTVQGHGVHTAFTETIDQLKSYTDYDVVANTGREADVVHIHTVGPYSLVKLLRGHAIKVVSAHVTPDSFVGSLIGAKYWYKLALAYLRWFYNRADGVLAVSQDVVEELTKMGVKRHIFLVPNTIDIRAFATTPQQRVAARKAQGIDPKRFVVVGNGQVQPRKRLDVFSKMAVAMPEVLFMWVGGIPFKRLGADAAEMTALMEHHPDNMVFTGLVDREHVLPYFQSADLFFLPSDQETFGIVVVEAAAVGLPVLLRDIAQYRQTFADGYERGTDRTFATQIKRFTTDKTYYQHWQQAARSIAERYDAKTGAQQLVSVYAEIIAERARAARL